MLQWYTAVAVTRPISDGLSHFQKTTGSGKATLFILLFSSRLKICRWSCPLPATAALSAMTLATGFIRAESAVMGRRRGAPGLATSTITTLFWAPVSRTQMYLSLSIVTFVNDTNCWLMPSAGSCASEGGGR